MSLMSAENLAALLENLGPKAKEELRYRRTGRSTRIAIETLVEALKNPGKAIRVSDHFATPEADRMLLDMIGDMAEKLGLEHLKFNRSRLTVTYTWVSPLAEKTK